MVNHREILAKCGEYHLTGKKPYIHFREGIVTEYKGRRTLRVSDLHMLKGNSIDSVLDWIKMLRKYESKRNKI